jgi:hypothetical protein
MTLLSRTGDPPREQRRHVPFPLDPGEGKGLMIMKPGSGGPHRRLSAWPGTLVIEDT